MTSYLAVSDMDHIGQDPATAPPTEAELLRTALDELIDATHDALHCGASQWQIDAAVMRGRRNYMEALRESGREEN